MTLRDILDQTLELLQAEGKYKTFGDLSKGKYQAEKAKTEDAVIRQMMYEGGLGNSKEALEKAKQTRKNNPKNKEINKKAAQKRAAWYTNSENYEKFMQKLRCRKKPKKS